MISIKEILSSIDYSRFIGNENICIDNIIRFTKENQEPDKLMWVNSQNANKIKASTKGVIICPVNTNLPLQAQASFILTNNPRHTFKIVLSHFFCKRQLPAISKTAKIDESCKLGENLFIGHNVVIESNCIIDDNSNIGHNSVILSGTIIRENVIIGNNCTIGGTGFGYEKDENGDYDLIPHIGNVIIKDNVEIGNNTTIDRAVIGSTIIKKNVKIDNMVHIAHGVEIGENTLVMANSMIAGSTIIGKDVWIAPSCAIINKIKIDNGAFIGIGSVVIKNVKAYARIFGNPAKSIPQFKK